MRYIKQEENTIIIARPIAQRLFLGFFGVLFAAMCFALMGYGIQGLISPSAASQAKPRSEHLALNMSQFLIPLMGLVPTVLFFHYAGEERLECDIVSRVYRYRRGLPLFARESSGEFIDFARLYVKVQKNNSVTQYLIYLAWNMAGRSDLLAGVEADEASALAQMRACQSVEYTGRFSGRLENAA